MKTSINDTPNTQVAPEENATPVENVTSNYELSAVDTPTETAVSMFTNASNEMYCSVKDDGSRASKIKIYNAIQSTSKRLADCLGDVIEIKDVIAHPITVVDDNGEVLTTLRTILIDKDGNTYESVSIGINNSISRIIALFGQPTWEEPIKVKVKQQGTRNGNNKINYLELV